MLVFSHTSRSCRPLWFVILCRWPDIEDGIFIWRLVCLLRAILSRVLPMWNVHLITGAMAVSPRFKMWVLLCLKKKKKKKRETMSRDAIADQICLQLSDCLSVPCRRGRHTSVGQKEITGQMYHFVKVATTETSCYSHQSALVRTVNYQRLVRNQCGVL